VLLGDATVAAEKTLTCLVAILSFATDYYPVATVAMSSIATVATDDVAKLSIATVATNQVVSVAKLSIATVAAVATDHAAVAKLSIATIAAVATDKVGSVATPLSQPSQPSQPVNYWSVDLSGII
jgi:hypothetical protein